MINIVLKETEEGHVISSTVTLLKGVAILAQFVTRFNVTQSAQRVHKQIKKLNSKLQELKFYY